jgi:DNA-binding NarL/FixJ family response regulator
VISVLLVDDHPVVIEGLRKVLATAGDIAVTGEAHDAAGALSQAAILRPDVILLDLRMPGASGVQATRRLREQDARAAVIILTSYGDQAYVRQALEAGADGYLLKSTPPEQLIAAIRAAARGRRALSPELLDGVLEDFGGLAREQMPEVFWSADVVVAVPWYEPFGIVPLEAMACGRPVVGSAVGGMLDTIAPGVTGELVPPRHPERLASVLRELLGDPSRRAEYGAAGPERVRQGYLWDQVAEQTERIYAQVAARLGSEVAS